MIYYIHDSKTNADATLVMQVYATVSLKLHVRVYVIKLLQEQVPSMYLSLLEVKLHYSNQYLDSRIKHSNRMSLP